MAPQPFTLSVPDAALADLRTRLALTRFPDAAPGDPWAFGTSVEYARELVGLLARSFRLARAAKRSSTFSRSSKLRCTISTCIT